MTDCRAKKKNYVDVLSMLDSQANTLFVHVNLYSNY